MSCLAIIFISCSTNKLPDYKKYNSKTEERITISNNHYKSGNNSLIKNKQGIWALYIEGNPLERGLSDGILTKELLYKQDKSFVDLLEKFIPSSFYQKVLVQFLEYFGRSLSKNIIEEYQIEIYGISRSSSKEFNFIAEPYFRMLHFHAAHDIGHAMQNMSLAGCTSFAAWSDKTEDGKLLIGRNLDFYVNDEFAENKIIKFINPDKGYKHAIVSWAGMIGALSGMNEKGLAVTINSGKSSIPLKAKTPISLLTREILQYAKNIKEAEEIVRKRKVFISESILVGSAEDKKAIIIEVSPKKTGIYNLDNDSNFQNYLVCSNHFQSEDLKNDKKNLSQIKNSHSKYRYERTTELINSNNKLTPEIAVDILRNKEGLDDIKLGYGNEKAINQLLSHHGVIFKPEERIMWVSSNPYQLGEFVAYNLDKVFRNFSTQRIDSLKLNISESKLNISEDIFLNSEEFMNYEKFRKLDEEINNRISNKELIEEEIFLQYIKLNPNFWKTYFTTAEYYFKNKNYNIALKYYNLALSKEITTIIDKELIEKHISQCYKKLKL